MAWGAAIGAGLQVLSQVLPHVLGGGKKGGGQVPYENTRNSAVRQAMALVEAGKQSGIHPLALLGAGVGGGGFAQPVGGSSINLGDAIGGGLSAIGDALYADDIDRRERDERERAASANAAERARERAIENLRSKEITPERRLALRNMELQNEALALDVATSRTKLANARNTVQGSAGHSVLVGPGGSVFSPVPGRASAQEGEEQYGEAGDLLFGTAGMIEDLTSGRVKSQPNWLGEMEILWNKFLQSRRYPGSATPKRYPG